MQAISEDALKLMVAEHGVRGTARLLQMDETQANTFRQRVARGKWMQDPAIAALRARSSIVPTGRPAAPAVSTLSPQAVLHAELARLGAETRTNLAKAIGKAGSHLAELPAKEIVEQSSNVKNIAQTADLVHGWKDQAPQVKIRLDVLGATAEQPVIEVESSVSDSGVWDCEAELDEY